MGIVFKNPLHVVCALLLALCIFFGPGIFQSVYLFKLIAEEPDTTVLHAFSESLALIWSVTADLDTTTLVINAAVAILIGTNLVLSWYYFEEYGRLSKTLRTAGLLGTLSGLIGAGCAACGSLAFVPLLTFLGGVGLLDSLPLHGNEISLIGIVLLVTSMVLQARAIRNPYR
jgi:hypothetical protein